jgi:glycosyltransferase involved in cell wall biosynthesis
VGQVELSFVMPAYNEGDSIEGALSSLDHAFRGSRFRYEVVVVDDGSVDSTRANAIKYASQNGHVRVIGQKSNVGKGDAVKKGFMSATGEAVIFVDSDLEIDLEQVSGFVEALKNGDIVIASKWHPDSVVDIPLVRRFLGLGFHVLVRLLTSVKLKDTQAGLKALRKSAFKDIVPRLVVKRYAFDVELLALANLYGLRIVEMPVNITMKSLFSFREAWWMFLDLLGIAYRLRVRRWYQRALKHSSRSFVEDTHF